MPVKIPTDVRLSQPQLNEALKLVEEQRLTIEQAQRDLERGEGWVHAEEACRLLQRDGKPMARDLLSFHVRQGRLRQIKVGSLSYFSLRDLEEFRENASEYSRPSVGRREHGGGRRSKTL